jgi:hypothetical protein
VVSALVARIVHRGWLLVVLIAGVGIAAAVVTESAAARADTARPSAPLAPAAGVLFGAYAGPGDQGPSPSVVDLEAKLGRRLAIDHFFRAWTSPFPGDREQWDIAGGRIPMISWGGVASSEINAGAHDDLIRTRAKAVQSFGRPVLIRWFPGMASPGHASLTGSPRGFLTAWHRLRRIFTEEQAANAVWVWCPDAADFATGSAPMFYPGDDDVDWTCAEGYDYRRPAKPHPTDNHSFEEIFAPFYTWAKNHPKAMLVGEYGVEEGAPGEKAGWVDAARDALKTHMTGIAAVVYYSATSEEDGATYDWRADSSGSALAAFTAMGSDSWFNPPNDTAADATIDSGPQGTVNLRDATFTFSATKSSSFVCHLNRAAWVACTSPRRYAGLGDGHHIFEVRSVDSSGREDPRAARWEWTIDTTEPEVVTTVPQDGASNVPPDSTISATFSKPLDAATVTATSFTLATDSGGGAVTGRVVYDRASRQAHFSPDHGLLPFVTYRATVTSAVKDAVGNTCRRHVWRFEAGLPAGPALRPTWSSPRRLPGRGPS